jgi:hypothetical protein
MNLINPNKSDYRWISFAVFFQSRVGRIPFRATSIYHYFYLKIFNRGVSLLTLFGSINTEQLRKGCASKDMPDFNSEYINLYSIKSINIGIFGVSKNKYIY